MSAAKAPALVSVSRYIKRRTRTEMQAIREALRSILEKIEPATVRATFYQATVRGVVAKTESECKQTVGRLLSAMRRAGEIPFEWVTDNTRWMRKPRTYPSLPDMLEQQKQLYRRALWDSQMVHCEIWLEKDALAGVLYPVTSEFDVPLMVTKGYPSLSFLHSAAEDILAISKPTYIYYFGDWDPTGKDISRAVEEGLREFAPEAEIHFSREAVTKSHIRYYELPTRPTKQSDPRAKNFEGESVELDAIAPPILREMVRNVIEAHLDQDELARVRLIEEQERETLKRIARNLPKKGGR